MQFYVTWQDQSAVPSHPLALHHIASSGNWHRTEYSPGRPWYSLTSLPVQ